MEALSHHTLTLSPTNKHSLKTTDGNAAAADINMMSSNEASLLYLTNVLAA